jgi:hypothetical protein
VDLQSTWADTPTFARRLLIILPVLGLATAILGILGDTLHWWEGWGFSINLLTSIVGFCIGAPVALIVLSAITGGREQRQQVNRTATLTKAAWDDFAGAVDAFCSDEVQNALDSVCQKVYDEYSWMVRNVQLFKARTPIQPEPLQPIDFETLQRTIEAWVLRIRPLMRELKETLGSEKQLQVKWAHILGKWRILDEYVRVQRLQDGLPWFGGDVDAQILTSLAPAINPIKPLAELFFSSSFMPLEIKSVTDGVVTLERWPTNTEEHVRLVLDRRGWFMSDPPGRFGSAAMEALNEVRQLREAIDTVRAEGWPTT